MTAMVDTGRGYIRPELEHLAVPVGQVRCYPGNARRGNWQKIRDSLLTHGQYKPLLVQRSTGYVLVGNNTLTVIQQQHWTHAAVQYLDVDDVAARKLLLMDNASSDAATYDTAELAELLAELPTLAGSGWALMDLDRMLAELDGTAALVSLPSVEDALPVSPAGPRLPDRATADPHPIPAPPVPAPLPVPGPDPIPVPQPVPPADPRLTSNDAPDVPPAAILSSPESHPPAPQAAPQPQHLPAVLPPGRAPAPPPPDADVPWHLTLTRADRDEALRLVAHARDWLDDPALQPGQVVMRALRTLAAIGDARHNPATTINLTTLLMAAGRDPFRSIG